MASYIFVICVELLAIKRRQNNKISGIKIGNNGFKLSQFADDNTVILDGSDQSLKEAINEIHKFGNISGLKINMSKTQLTWIRAKMFSTDTLCPELNLTWGCNKFTLLGKEFSVNLHSMPRLNFDKKLVKLKSDIKNWQRRKLTPIGRITVYKTLIMSQFNHLFATLPAPDTKYFSELNDIMYTFIWEGKTYKIKRSVSSKEYCMGGLKIPNLYIFNDAIKTTWIRRYLTGD